MEQEDLNIMSEFMVMAATLIDIKCKMLLPKEVNEEGEEEDPRAELVQKLLEYKMYKYASYELKDMEMDAVKSYYKGASIPDEVKQYKEEIDPADVIGDVTLAKLNEIFNQVMRRTVDRVDPIRSKFGTIEKEEVRIEDKMEEIRASIRGLKGINFRTLLEVQASRINIIVTLSKNGLADSYNNSNHGYDSLSEYVNTITVSSEIAEMTSEQDELASELLKKKLISKVNHSYTTLFNGFSATTTYGQYKKLLKANYDVDVVISEVYSEPKYQVLSSDTDYDAVVNEVDVYETGIFNSSGVGYDGNNTAVAILDSGYDIHHTVFQNMPDQPAISMSFVEERLYKSKAYSYHQNIKVQDVYVNSKIPFAYDYADKDTDVAPYESNHGTHVAGIIAGQDDVITGVAINTQLVLMKVFGDVNNDNIIIGNGAAELINNLKHVVGKKIALTIPSFNEYLITL